MKKTGLLKWIALGLSTAAILAACGGGGSDPLPVVPKSTGPVTGSNAPVNGTVIVSYSGTALVTAQGGNLGHFKYVGPAGSSQTSTVAVINGVYTLDGSFTGGSGSFGGLALTVDVPAGSQNWSGASKLSIQLASSGTSNQLYVRLKGSASTVDDGCVPSYLATVTSNMLTYDIDLTPTNFPLPGHCGSTSNPAFAGVIGSVVQIQVEDNTFPSSGSASVGIRVGQAGLVTSGASTPPSTPTNTVTAALSCNSGTNTNAVISFNTGNTSTTAQGATIQSSRYSDNSGGSTAAFETNNGCLSVRGANGGTVGTGYAGMGANLQLAPAGATVSWASGGTLTVPIASTNTGNLKVVLSGGTSATLNGGCFPTAAISAGTALNTQSFALNATTFQLPGYCTLGMGETQASLLANALANLRQIQIEDNNIATGVNMSIGTISRIAPAAFSTLADINNTTFAQSLNSSFSSTGITGDNSAVTVFTAAGTDTRIQLFSGAGGANISSATTLRLKNVAASAATTVYVSLGKQPAGSCMITYEFTVSPTVGNVDVPLSTLSATAGNVGQTNCSVAGDIAAIKASVGDVQLRAFANSGTAPVTLTIDEVQYGN